MNDFEKNEYHYSANSGGIPSGNGSGYSYNTNEQTYARYEADPTRGSYTYSSPQKPKKERKALKFICALLACALVGGAAGVGGAYLVVNSASGKTSTTLMTAESRPQVDVDTLSVKPGDVMTASQIYAAYNESVVSIQVEGEQGMGAGTGFVSTEDGYIITCYHVVDGAKAISVTFTDTADSFPAEYVGGDATQDIAVIKIDAGEERTLKPVVLGDNETLGVGSTVTAIGNALGTLSNTTTTGIVSALNRAITMSDGTVMSLMQTDCSINSGNSGGPLFNEYGEVIGVVNAKYTSSAYNSGGATIEGIGFAIPINDVTAIFDDLVNHGYVTGKPYLGISVSTVSALTAQRYDGYVEGAYVNSVNEGSCAEEAGLKAGDIITAVDGVDITTSAELIDAKNRHRAGDDMKLTVYRNKESLLIVVTLDEQNPETESAAQSAPQQTQPQQQPNDRQNGGYYDFYEPFSFPFNFFW